MNTLLERAMLFVLFLSIIFSALAQGVVDAWAIGVLECLSGLLLLLWVSKVVIGGKLKVVMPQVILPILAFFLLGLLHCLAFNGKDGAVASLSSDVEATRKTVFLFFFLIIELLVSIQLFHSRKRLVVAVNFLVVYGLAMAMFALIQHFTWNGKFYWLKPNKQSVSPFGPFVSHNHFAGYMEMLIPLALALMWKRDAKTEARLFYGFAGLVMSVASIASLSRGGMLSLGALIVFLIIGKWQRRQSTRKSERRSSSSSRNAMEVAHRQNVPAIRRKSPAAARTIVPTFLKGMLATAAVAVALLVGMVWVGPDRVSNRLSSGKLVGDNQNNETFFSSRGWIWKDSWQMIKAHPLFGVGIGAYETAYPIYSSSNGAIIVGQTHNDYLQVLADAGIIGGALALWFIFLIWREIWRGIRLRDATLSSIALGSGAGIFAILIHSFLDFNLQLPSNILLFFILVAMVAQSVAVSAAQERKGLESGRQLQQLPESSAKAIRLPV
jgi:O-antigen ligase